MNHDRLGLMRCALEQLLRERLQAFQGFELSGAMSMEQLGMDEQRAVLLLPIVGRTLGIALPDHHRHNGVFQTPNTLLAFVCAAALERALSVRTDDCRNEPS